MDKRKKIEPKFKIHDLVRTLHLKTNFSKSDTTNWSYKLYKFTKINTETIPSFHLDNLPERYNEALLKKTKLTLEENKDVMNASNLN